MLLLPSMHGGRSPIDGDSWKTHAFRAFVGIFVNISIVLGVWTRTAIRWVGLEERAATDLIDVDDDGDAYASALDTIGRMSGLAWMLLPPYFAVVTKLAEASNEAPLLVLDRDIHKKLDSVVVRLLVTLLNYTALGLEVYAAVRSSAAALVWAGVVILPLLMNIERARSSKSRAKQVEGGVQNKEKSEKKRETSRKCPLTADPVKGPQTIVLNRPKTIVPLADRPTSSTLALDLLEKPLF